MEVENEKDNIFIINNIFLVSCNAMYPVANYNLKYYNKNSDGTYTRKTDKNGNPIKTKIVIEEIIEEGKKFNYNPQK